MERKNNDIIFKDAVHNYTWVRETKKPTVKRDKSNRDEKYIAHVKSLNDHMWRTKERGLYYSYKNQEYVIPTFLICVVIFFTNPMYLAITGIIMFVLGALYLCHCNNVELDKSEWVQKEREYCKNFRRKYGML